jgi:hypothetical protein
MPSLKLRGRAASKVRVGDVIKKVLSGKEPDEDGKLLTEAAIVDIHHIYKKLIRDQNALRSKKLKPMVYSSFITQFRFAEKLNLVQLVRKEPMLFPPPTGNLYTFRVHDGNIGEISQRHIYKLTPIGMRDELSWTNLTQAYIQHWVAPQAAPEYEVVEKVYKFPMIPSMAALIGFRTYLQSTKVMTVADARTYSMRVGDWTEYFTARAKVSGNADYTKLALLTEQLSVNLTDNPIKSSIDTLTDIIAALEKVHSVENRQAQKQEKPEAETLQDKLHDLMDSDNKAKSIEKLRSALDELDHDKYEGIDDVESAIEDYESIERAGLTPAQYGEDRQSAFDEIDEAIDTIVEENNEEENESEKDSEEKE